MSTPISDEKLTAYALDELEGEDRAAVEAHLAANPEARREVEEVRATARLLAAELADEPGEGLLAVHRAAIERELAEPSPKQRPPVGEIRGPRRRRILFGLSVAASILIVAATISILFPKVFRTQQHLPRAITLNDVSDSTRAVQSRGGDGSARHFQPGQNARSQDQLDGTLLPSDSQGVPNFSLQSATEQRAGPGIGAGGKADLAPPPTNDILRYPDDWSAVEKKVWAQGSGFNTEAYDRLTDNPFLRVSDNPLSTFSIDVDTASYSNVRRYLNQNALPPKDAVRIEEMVNYFPYGYAPPPPDGTAPFSANIEVAGCPWETKHRLVRIGLKGKEISHDKRPASNIVFLVDVSGSMEPANKLPLVKRGLTMLTGQLTENDRVAMVVYAGSSGLVLPGTTGDQKGTIIGAIEALGAGGSTNGAGGIERAYEVAAANFIKGGVNRVILCTDGDFNVGITDQGALTRLIEEKAKTGAFLSVLGFGMGNLKDATMEQLADKGNGNYAYVDTPAEARKVLVEQMAGTLVTIAKDVKVQVEFNPAVASAYRLIGYENRVLAKEDFNDDKKDAGEIGAGHTVTALYEVVPAGTDAAEKLSPQVDALKYQKPLEREPTGSGELLTLKLRYKEPEGETSKLLEFPVTDGGASYAKASGDYKFAAAVSAFGMILRDSPHKGSATLPGVTELAAEGLGKDENGYRAEFIGLVEKARRIKEAQGSSAHAIPGAPSEG